MKTVAETNRGEFHIEQIDEGFRLTNFQLPTEVVPNEAALLAKLADSDGDVKLKLPSEPNSVIIFRPGERHGKQGYRACRYDDFRWDENSMFFNTISEILNAISTNDYTAAHAAF